MTYEPNRGCSSSLLVSIPEPYQPQSKICQLPYHVFNTILQSLPVWELDDSLLHGSFHRENRYALSSLSQSCRGLQNVTEPVLYSTIVGQDRDQDLWEFESAEQRTQVGSNNKRGRILKLLRTLLSRPRLAYFVEALVILPRPNSSNNAPSKNEWLMSHYKLQSRLFASNSQLQMLFTTDLCRGSTDAEAALLFGLASNIKHLHLGIATDSFSTTHPWLISLFRHIRLEPHTYRYSQLERITLLHRTRQRNHNYNHNLAIRELLLEFLRVPTLKSFEAGIDLPRFREHESRPSELTSYTHLDHQHCEIRGLKENFDSLKTIFQGCKGLKHFRKRFACVGDWAAGYPYTWTPVWNQMPAILSSQHQTLETMHLSTLDISRRTSHGSWPTTWSEDQLQPIPPIPSLRHFATLRSLSIDQIILLGNRSEKQSTRALVDALPPSMQHLVITRCKGYAVDAQLFPMIESIACFPRLKSIVTERDRDWARFTKTIMLMDRQEEAKIACSNNFAFAEGDDDTTFLYLVSAIEEEPGFRDSSRTNSILGHDDKSSDIDHDKVHYYGYVDNYEDSFEGRYKWLSHQHKILVEGFRKAGVEWIYS